jgi:phage terminase small subunit
MSFQGPERTGFKGHPRKKALFVAALIAGKNIKQAREEAGIAVATGWKWSQQPEVRDKVEKGISDAALYAGVSRAWVISKLKEVAERCMQAQPVLDKLGHATGLYVFDSSGANRSLELLGKHLRVFGEDASAQAQLGASVMRLLAQEAQTLRRKKESVTVEVITDGKSGGSKADEVDGRSGEDGRRRVQGGEPGPVAGGVSEGVSAPAEDGGDRVQGPG